jgi:hypothetical protein
LAFAENVNRLGLIGSMGTVGDCNNAPCVRSEAGLADISGCLSDVTSERCDVRKCSGSAGGTVQIGLFADRE